MITEQEIQKFEAFISKLPLEHNRSSNEFGYDNPVLLCLDAVLSMNRKYDSFVVPRIHLFVESYPEINRLEKLHDLIQRLGHDGFCEAWNYKHVERVQILERLCTRLMEITQTQNAPTEIAALKQWARSARPHDYQEFGVNGIGLATFQYIRMMLGVPTVKPDIHINRAVFLVLGTNKNKLDAIELIETASRNQNLDPTLVDHNIWNLFSSGDLREITRLVS